MHVVISPGDINSYKVNEQEKYIRRRFRKYFSQYNVFLGKTRYSLYSSCCGSDFQGNSRWM